MHITPIQLHDPGPSSPAPGAAGFLVDLQSVTFSEDDGPTRSWIHSLPLGTYTHPRHGDIKITPERVKRFADNVKNKVRGQDLDIDYDHKGDISQGGRAAGWVADAEARPDGLWLLVEWTKAAAQAIRNREWKYFSPEFVNEWMHPKTGEQYKDVLFGGGLTNRPFLKDILPINLSEVFGQQGSEPQHKEGEEVDRKKICQRLGLSEDASDEDILQKLTELAETNTKLSELLEGDDLVEAVKQLKEPPEKETEGNDPVKQLAEQLGEDSPTVKLLRETVEQNNQLKETVANLTRDSQEAGIEKKLSEIDVEGKRLTPAQREDFKQVLLSTPSSGHEHVYKLAEDVAKNSGVDLNERGGTPPGGQRDEDSATKQLNDRVAALIKDSDDKLSYGEAVEMAFREDPALYDVYRRESFSREET